ncbi:hypothetical protein EFR01_35330 [Sinorhizobium fredii]|nr:hypothetical protein EFR01_35330 [Sinorhizobium fredii]GLS07664.1 hypothetical protein GCM10007864_12910 [Sinorhizobium fredii]
MRKGPARRIDVVDLVDEHPWKFAFHRIDQPFGNTSAARYDQNDAPGFGTSSALCKGPTPDLTLLSHVP